LRFNRRDGHEIERTGGRREIGKRRRRGQRSGQGASELHRVDKIAKDEDELLICDRMQHRTHGTLITLEAREP
jgi:hypothetical protein